MQSRLQFQRVRIRRCTDLLLGHARPNACLVSGARPLVNVAGTKINTHRMVLPSQWLVSVTLGAPHAVGWGPSHWSFFGLDVASSACTATLSRQHISRWNPVKNGILLLQTWCVYCKPWGEHSCLPGLCITGVKHSGLASHFTSRLWPCTALCHTTMVPVCILCTRLDHRACIA